MECCLPIKRLKQWSFSSTPLHPSPLFETPVGSRSLGGRVGNLNNNTPKASTPISEKFLYIVCKVYGKPSSLRALLRSQHHIFLSKNQYIIFERLKGKKRELPITLFPETAVSRAWESVSMFVVAYLSTFILSVGIFCMVFFY